MRNVISGKFAWELFETTGNIESYLLYREFDSHNTRIEDDEKYTDNSAGAENL